ncbi:MAG: AAA family ATPase [Candidatus Coatesbacteria bacterium]|nr:AAA family ATPase [Candidatus Coatesbacteria bacterium]
MSPTPPAAKFDRKQFENDLREAINCLFEGDNLMMAFQLAFKYYYSLPENWLLQVIIYYATFYSDDALNNFIEEDKAVRGLANFEKDTYSKKIFGEALIALRKMHGEFKKSFIYPEMGVLGYRLLGLYEELDMQERFNGYDFGAKLGLEFLSQGLPNSKNIRIARETVRCLYFKYTIDSMRNRFQKSEIDKDYKNCIDIAMKYDENIINRNFYFYEAFALAMLPFSSPKAKELINEAAAINLEQPRLLADLKEVYEVHFINLYTYKWADKLNIETDLAKERIRAFINSSSSKEELDSLNFMEGEDVSLVRSFFTQTIQTFHKEMYLNDEDLKKGLSTFTVQKITGMDFSRIAGFEDLKKRLYEEVVLPFRYPAQAKRYQIDLTRGILLYGPPGCGKSLIMQALCGETGMNFIDVKSSDISGVWLGTSAINITNLFKFAKENAPSLILLDELDAFLTNRAVNMHEEQRKAVNQFLAEMGNLSRSEGQILIVGATNRPWALDPAALRPGRLDRMFYVGVPDEDMRTEIFRLNLENRPISDNIDYRRLAQETDQYSGAEIQNITDIAASKALSTAVQQEKEILIDMPLLLEAQKEIQPTLEDWFDDCYRNIESEVLESKYMALKEEMERYYRQKKKMPVSSGSASRGLSIFSLSRVNDVTFNDVMGLADVKETLYQEIFAPLEYPQLARHYGLKANRGILLYGPPGCGKTMLAKAISARFQAGLINVKVSEIVDMWVGNGARNIQNLFKFAGNHTPCVVFLDELDILCGKRESVDRSQTSVHLEMVNQLLVELDGFGSNDEEIMVIGASNRPWAIDEAILRPGRIDRLIYIGVPTIQARLDMFKHKFKLPPQLTDEEWKTLSKLTEGYSGAEIENICYLASQSQFAKVIKENTRPDSTAARIQAPPVDFEAVKNSINLVKPKLWGWFESCSAAIDPSSLNDKFQELACELKYQARIHKKMIYAGSDQQRGLAKFQILKVTDRNFKTMIGLKSVKEILKQEVLLPMKEQELARNYGLDLSRGFLFYGAPGTGKSFCAYCLAGEADLSLIPVKGSELLDLWSGNASKNIANLFNTAIEQSPSLILVDDIDILWQKQTTNELIAQFQLELDALQGKNTFVYFIGTTKNPHMVSSSLLSTGRIDRFVYFSLPDESERKEYLESKFQGQDVTETINASIGFSFAEMDNAYQLCIQKVFQDSINQNKGKQVIPVSLFREIIMKMQPAARTWLKELKEEISISRISEKFPEMSADFEKLSTMLLGKDKKFGFTS